MSYPTYEQANPTRRWDGPISDLWPALRSKAYHAQGDWWWYILPNGLLVACKIGAGWRKIVRIARLDPVDEDAWKAEVQDVIAHLTVPGGWYELPVNDEDRGEAAHVAVFLELRSNEHAPDVSKCNDCGAEIPSAPIVVPMRCETCLLRHRLAALPDLPDRHAAIIGER